MFRNRLNVDNCSLFWRRVFSSVQLSLISDKLALVSISARVIEVNIKSSTERHPVREGRCFYLGLERKNVNTLKKALEIGRNRMEGHCSLMGQREGHKGLWVKCTLALIQGQVTGCDAVFGTLDSNLEALAVAVCMFTPSCRLILEHHPTFPFSIVSISLVLSWCSTT